MVWISFWFRLPCGWRTSSCTNPRATDVSFWSSSFLVCVQSALPFIEIGTSRLPLFWILPFLKVLIRMAFFWFFICRECCEGGVFWQSIFFRRCLRLDHVADEICTFESQSTFEKARKAQSLRRRWGEEEPGLPEEAPPREERSKMYDGWS